MKKAANIIKSLTAELVNDKKLLLKILSISLILLLALILRVHNSNQSEISVEAATETPEAEIAELYVDIDGAVHRPGVYKVEEGTRLYEVIELAGGLRSDADTNSVNQASFVVDGDKIIIPVYSEGSDEDALDTAGGDMSRTGADTSGLVNINIADKETLKTLPGVGDVIADRIIEYRTTGRFRTKEDIMQVKGIGNSIFEKLKDSISV